MATILKLIGGHYSPPQESTKKIGRDAAVEFVATTLFVFSGTMSAVSTSKTLTGEETGGNVAQILPIAMCFGITILALAHSIGHLTGGHMNPGVSLLMFLKGQMSGVKMCSYWFAQFFGAIIASSLVWGCTSGLTSALGQGRPPFTLGSTTLAPELNVGNGFLIELMGAIVFYFVIAQTALDKRGIATTAFPAIPIGLILVVVHVCLIPFTGCGVNPARTFGPSVVTCMAGNSEECKVVANSDWYWIYYIAPALAAFVVAEITTVMEMKVDEEEAVNTKVAKETPEGPIMTEPQDQTEDIA